MLRRPPRSTPFPTRRSSDLNSKIIWIIHEVADVYGPRVTGTPNLKAADDWAIKTMTAWGLANAHLDRKSTRLNSSHITNSYAVFCLKKKKRQKRIGDSERET